MLRRLVEGTMERLIAAAMALIGLLVALRYVLGTRYVDALRDLDFAGDIGSVHGGCGRARPASQLRE